MLAAVGGVTWGVRALALADTPTDAALVYLLVVLAATTASDVWTGALASVLATFALNMFFLPPLGTLTIANPENWFALFAFLVVAVVAGQLVGRARLRTREALRREATTRALLALTERLYAAASAEAGDGPVAVAAAVARACGEALGATACAIRLEGGAEAGVFGDAAALAGAPWAAQVAPSVRPAAGPWVVPIPARQVTAALAVAPPVREPEMVSAAASLAAAALDRAFAARDLAQAAAARERESFQSALLSSVSHELRTPLATIQLAATALMRAEVWRDEPARGELLASLDEESERLNDRIRNLLAMSEVQAGSLVLRADPVEPQEVVAAAMRHLGRAADRARIEVEVAPALPLVGADLGLCGIALANLLDNALKYSPAAAPVRLSVRGDADGGGEAAAVAFAVADLGPGVAPPEVERVFERFYRVPAAGAERPSGTGLGLTISRALARAHGGDVGYRDGPAGGAVFTLRLPALAPDPGRMARAS